MRSYGRKDVAMNLLYAACRTLCIIGLVVVLAGTCLAQSSGTGAITGTVTDPSGAVVPNVAVTVTSLDNGQARSTTTSGNGSYQVNLLLPGNYSVKFEAAGFQSTTFASVSVTVTETGTLNAQMQVGAQTQQVTVEANVETVQTATSTLGTVVGSQAVVELPLNTRNFTNLIALSAGANATVNNATTMGKGYQAISVNGASSAQNNFQMDGVSIVNYMGNGTQQELGTFGGIEVPPPDSIQEFKIQTSTYDASYGKNTGANVNLVTKSGTNAYHGTAFEFFRNTKLNANDFFLKRSELTAGVPFATNKEAVLNQNQYGGVFGGPIKKDKLFFFTSYQRTWQKNGLADSAGAAYNLHLPPIPAAFLAPGTRGNCALGATSVAACNDGGVSASFAAALGANVCPATGPGGTAIANNNTSNNIAAQAGGGTATSATVLQVHCNGDDISPVALRLLQTLNPPGTPNAGKYYLTGSGLTPAGAANSFGYQASTLTIPAYFFEHQGMGNIDYVINSKNTFSGKFYYGVDPNYSYLSDALTVAPFLIGNKVSSQYTNGSGVAKLTTIITNNLVNEARFTYQRNAIDQNNANNIQASGIGMTNIGNPGEGQIPYIAIGGVYNFGTHNFSVSFERANQFFAQDQISWTHGKHTIRAGFEWEHDLYFWNYPAFGYGLLTIPTFADFLLGLPGGCGSASTVAPYTCNGSTVSNVNTISSGSDRFLQPKLIDYPYSWTTSAFAQDDLKVNSKLTLNLGLRWEYDPLVSEKNGASVGMWYSLVQTQPIPGTGCSYNGFSWGAGAGGTGCSFNGYAVANNYNTGIYPAVPAGAYVNRSSAQAPHASPTPLDNFAPRVGFAWQPLSTNKLVVRGGFGYFYTRLSGGQLISGLKHSPPIAAALNQAGAANAASSLVSPFPPYPAGFIPRWANLSTGADQNLNFSGSGSIAETMTTPLTYQYNLNVQYQFAPSWVLELGYVGSHGIHQYLVRHENGALLANIAHPLYGVLQTSTTAFSPTVGGSASGTADAAIRAPELGLANAFALQTTDGSYIFNSLQATVRKQFSHGLQFQGAYTWSRAFAAAEVGNANQSFTNNVPVILDYGLNPLYHPHRLVLNYNWELPFGKHQGFMDKLASGWSVSGVTTIQDGTPLTITNTSLGSTSGNPATSNAQFAPGMGNANVPTAGSVEQRIGGYPASAGLPSGYFNAAAFAASTAAPVQAANLAGCSGAGVVSNTCAGTLFGNAGLGIILGPGQNNYDISISKNTRVGGLREDATLQFRAEFFNAFNHAQFANPIAGNLSSASGSNFGVIGGTSVNPRLVQLALKYSF